MKGKASIILTDADSGRIVRRLEEKNIITNAVENVFNLPLEYRINSINHSAVFTSALPVWNTLMGGILLLGNNVTEDADNIFLPPDSKIIATAGAPYSGISPNIGSLNQNECCEIDNGYRLTWDFATDKANDTIKCICLTSRQFGNSGAWSTETTRGVAFGNPTNMTNADTGMNGLTMFTGKGQFVCSKSSTKHVYFVGELNRKLRFIEQTSIDPKNIRINDTAGSSVLCKQTAEYIVEAPFDFVTDRRFFFNPDTMCLYFFKERQFDSAANVTNVEYIAIDIKTYTIAEHRQISIAGNCSFDYAAVYYDSLFVTYGQTLYRYSLDGSLMRVYDSGTIDWGFFVINGCLYTFIDSTCLYMVSPEGGCRLSRVNGTLACAASFLKPPLIATATRINHSVHDAMPTVPVYAQIFNAYMASINNLSEPITKTSAQTLKIIYEITN